MTETALTLRDLLAQAAARHAFEGEPASTRDLERTAAAGHHPISHETIAKILKGQYALRGARPKRKTMEAIAYLAGVPYGVVHEAAGWRSEPGRPFVEQVPEDFDELSLSQRELVIRVGRALLDAQKRNVYLDTPERGSDHSNGPQASVAWITRNEVPDPEELTQSDESQ